MTPEKVYWFPAKRYGWGWGLPVAWQGWLVLALWLVAVLASAMAFLPTRVLGFVVAMSLLTVLLIVVCAWTGEPPSWRWGVSR